MKSNPSRSTPARGLLAACLLLTGPLLGPLHETQAAETPAPPTATPTPPAPAPAATPPAAAAPLPDEAEVAWKAVDKASRPPVPPLEWRTQQPTQEELTQFRTQQGKLAEEAANLARDFATKYPAHPRQQEARTKENQMLQTAMQLGNTNVIARLEAFDEEKLKTPNLSEEDRFKLKIQGLERRMASKRSAGKEALLNEMEKTARELQKEFPAQEEPYGILLEVASNTDGDKAATLAKEIANLPQAPEKIKVMAGGLLKKFEALGKPMAIAFKALDGREVDLSKMKGQVVLVDFWATWCGPCVAELPNVKAAYAKLHPKGFEILGISFDQDQSALEKMVKEKEMTWPQYFDGEGWSNKFGQQFGITSIPSMWLVDKKGILRDFNGREDLENKVEKLLQEK